jgi:hypothetical protein
MNNRSRQFLRIGAFFAVAVILLDLLLFQIPILEWLGLGLSFALVAAILIGVVAQGVPKQTPKSVPGQQNEDDFEHLTNTVEAGIWGGHKGAKRILSEHLKSLTVGVIAARTKLSKKEILNLLENDPQSLHNIVHDGDLLRLLLDCQKLGEGLNERNLEQALLKIGS